MSRTRDSRFSRSLKRNLDELARAILNLKALKGLETADTDHGIDFVRLSHWALFNDCFANAMRAFDEQRGAASFWYLCRCEEAELDKAAATVGVEIAELKRLSSSLKLVRNKTHFHIEEEGGLRPKGGLAARRHQSPRFRAAVARQL